MVSAANSERQQHEPCNRVGFCRSQVGTNLDVMLHVLVQLWQWRDVTTDASMHKENGTNLSQLTLMMTRYSVLDFVHEPRHIV